MDERQATKVVQALGGEIWQSGGGIWLVLLRRADGMLTVISDEVVCEYETEQALEENQPHATILLR